MKLRLAVCAVVLLTTPLLAVQSGSFQLKIFQGYSLSSQRVLESGASDADVSFTYQTRRFGIISYLNAAKISQVQTTSGLTASQVEAWDDYVAAPSPGKYVIKARNGRYYLLTLRSFENQGRAASYWRMTFDWQELSLGGSPASQRGTGEELRRKPVRN